MTARGGERRAPAAAGPRPGHLALAFQEAITAIIRVSSDRRDVADPELFRQQFKQVLSAAHDEARKAGYPSEDVRLAVYAVVVLLDEAVLHSRQPAFREWARRPLQEEVFGGHVGGEAFYDRMRELLGRQDVEAVADVLEVYVLCLVLGFRGRYAGAGEAERQQWMSAATQHVARWRSGGGALCPAWAPPAQERIRPPGDPWLLRLALGAAAGMMIALVLFLGFTLSLRGGLAAVRALVTAGP